MAILVFTLFVKALFFPLATKSYKSMSKMKLLAPRMTELRERHKGDQRRCSARPWRSTAPRA